MLFACRCFDKALLSEAEGALLSEAEGLSTNGFFQGRHIPLPTPFQFHLNPGAVERKAVHRQTVAGQFECRRQVVDAHGLCLVGNMPAQIIHGEMVDLQRQGREEPAQIGQG